MSDKSKVTLMTAAQDYFEQVLALGHPPEHALTYTRQHFPDFVPGVPASMASPQPTLDVEEAEPSPTKAYAAAALLLLGALLSVTAQFNHEWVVLDEEVNTLGLSAGLTTIRADCATAVPVGEFTQEEATGQCREFAYVWFADDMEAAAAENKSADDLGDVFVGDQDVFCDNVESYSEEYQELLAVLFVYGGAPELEPLLYALVSSSYICLGVGHDVSSDDQWGDNTRAGLVLWLGSIVALLGTALLVAAAVGRELPGNIERHGKRAAYAAGLTLLAAMGLSGVTADGDLEIVSYGMGFWITGLGGVLSIVAGVLAFKAKKQTTRPNWLPTKAHLAVVLLLMASLLSLAAHFSHDWIAINEREDQNPLGLSAGLTTIRADCTEAMPYNGNSQANATEQCKAIAYVWFADAMETAAAENRSADDLDDVFVSSHENYCNNIEMLWNNNRPIGSSYDEFSPSEFALISSNTICRNVGYYADSPASKEDLPPLDESLTGVIHVLGSVVALLGSGLLAAAAAGRELPGNIEREGKWVSFAAMVVIITAVLVFAMDANSHLFGTKMGTGQIMALLSGVLSMCATVLSFLVKK